MINLSASGLYGIIETNPLLNPGGILPLEIMIPLFEEAISLEGKVIRIDKTNKAESAGIALQFEHPTEKLQNQLTKYLFQRQRELIREGRIKIGRIE